MFELDVTPPTIKREEILLLLLSAVPGGFFGAVQIQKSMFLLSKNLPNLFEQPYDFQPGGYGPSDGNVYSDFRILVKRDLACLVQSTGSASQKYVANHKGLAYASTIDISTENKNYIHSVANWILSLSFSEIVGSIIRAYPEMGNNVIFNGS